MYQPFHSKALKNLSDWYFWFENIPSGIPGCSVEVFTRFAADFAGLADSVTGLGEIAPFGKKTSSLSI
jgi:hypothetical protein